MRFHYTQVFLLVWVVVFWIYHFSTYGRVEGRHERAVRKKCGVRARWAPLFGLAFLAWTTLIVIYFFDYNLINWIRKFSLLDRMAVKIAGFALLSCAMLVYVLFTRTVGRAIGEAADTGDKPALITAGVYRLSRHPAYLSFVSLAFGTFLVIPNLVTLILLAYTGVVTYGHTVEEEKKLLAMYGQEYEEYRKKVGMFLPGLG
jgi:protein-S-isoprenylcysteine O-methyltransferase Ste14